MENKGFWIGGIVLALIVGIVLGVILQKRKDKKAKAQAQKKTTPTTPSTEQPPLKATVEPEKPDASLIKTA